MEGNVFALGDLHGADKALYQLLTRINFNTKKDKLIFLGDLADGWGYFEKCLDIFLKIKKFTPILGNHDLFLKKYIEHQYIDDRWLNIDECQTMAWVDNHPSVVNKLKEYFSKAVYFHLEGDKIFTHGGFDDTKHITNQKRLNFAIDRSLYQKAKAYDRQSLRINPTYDHKNSKEINEIFIGHNTTKKAVPEFYANLINLDTGAASKGRLTLMDIHSKEYYQSQRVNTYYRG